MHRAYRALWSVMCLVALACCASHAGADEFYGGKTVKLYIGSGPGGGYDLFGRLVARHIGNHLPGHPAVIAENMPGAGSVRATNYIYNAAPKDGLSLAIASPSLAVTEALQKPGVRFKVSKLQWIGRVASIVNVMVTRRDSSVKTIADARRRETLISAISATSPLTIIAKVMNATAGTKFKLVQGYADSAATLLALDRREVDGTTVSWATLQSLRAGWVQDKKLNVLVQFSQTRSRELPEVPAAVETASTPDDAKLLSLFVSGADVGYSIFTSPGAPDDRVRQLRAAFAEMAKDPKFISDANHLHIDLDPMTGDELQAMIAKTTVFPASLKARAKQVSSSGS